MVVLINFVCIDYKKNHTPPPHASWAGVQNVGMTHVTNKYPIGLITCTCGLRISLSDQLQATRGWSYLSLLLQIWKELISIYHTSDPQTSSKTIHDVHLRKLPDLLASTSKYYNVFIWKHVAFIGNMYFYVDAH